MAEEIFGFTADDVRRIRKAVEFYESYQRNIRERRERTPATVDGIDYVTGTLTEDLDFQSLAMMTLDTPIDDGTTELEVYGRWFEALSGDKIGATYNPYTDQYDADRRVCDPDSAGSDDIDGGSASGGGGTEDGGDAGTGGGDLDGGTP